MTFPACSENFGLYFTPQAVTASCVQSVCTGFDIAFGSPLRKKRGTVVVQYLSAPLPPCRTFGQLHLLPDSDNMAVKLPASPFFSQPSSLERQKIFPSLGAGIIMAGPRPQDASVQVRVYDRDHRDYHNWDDREDRAYRRYYVVQRRTYREYDKQNSKAQRKYWKWRHTHPDND